MRTLLAIIIITVTGLSRPAVAEWPEGAFSCRAYRADLVWRHWARKHCAGYRWRWRHRYAPRPNAETMAAQLKLQQLGFHLRADGLMGPETRRALQLFQHGNDLPATGNLDRATLFMLREIEEDDYGEDENVDCKPSVRGIGTEDYSLDDARAKAIANWLERVRFRYGVMFMDPRHAKGVEYICGQSGTGGRKGEKLTAAVPFGIAEGFAGGDVLLQCEVVAKPCATPPTDEIVHRRRSSRDLEHNGGHQ